jgi:hypothetical protein
MKKAKKKNDGESVERERAAEESVPGKTGKKVTYIITKLCTHSYTT